MFEDGKILLSLLAVFLTVVGYVPYLRGMYAGVVKPHLFTWIVWTTTTLVAAGAQIAKGGGVGAWPTVIAAALCCWVLLLSVKRGSKDIRKIDWYCLWASLSALPLWIVLKDPTWSAVLVTCVESVASFPTIRKSWLYPSQETVSMYFVGSVRFLLSIMALEAYSVATVVYPAGMIVMSVAIIAVLMFRRAQEKIAR